LTNVKSRDDIGVNQKLIERKLRGDRARLQCGDKPARAVVVSCARQTTNRRRNDSGKGSLGGCA
jgi:hypothetical protein